MLSGNTGRFSGKQAEFSGKEIFQNQPQLPLSKWFEQNWVRGIKSRRKPEVFLPRTGDKKDFYRADTAQQTGEKHAVDPFFLLKIEHRNIR